ncbi:MAG: hypothetical protein LBI42_13440 [Chitinispirillales bacterium]|jgi:hypothetical protein|nr:hypothetical protein [Chitinispirillales bacterium]
MESLKDFFAPVTTAALIGLIFAVIAAWLFFKNLRMPADFVQRERARDELRLRLMEEKKLSYLTAAQRPAEDDKAESPEQAN